MRMEETREAMEKNQLQESYDIVKDRMINY